MKNTTAIYSGSDAFITPAKARTNTDKGLLDLPDGQLKRLGEHYALVSEKHTGDPFEVDLIYTRDERRSTVEHFIKNTFALMHDARVSTFMPAIFAAFNQQGKPRSTVGFNYPSAQALFLEQYIDTPIEKMLALHTGKQVSRQRIAEVGNLASQHPGACKKLFLLLVLYFYEKHIDWAVFTGTEAVRGAFKKLGLETVLLAKADRDRLGEAKDQWGSYYDHTPYVMACDIQAAMRRVSGELKLMGH